MCINDGVKGWVGQSLVPKPFSTKQGKIGLVNINGIFHFHSLWLKKLRHNICKKTTLSSSEVQDHRGKKILERKTSFSDRETLEQTYWHSNFPLSVVKLSNTSQTFMKLLTALKPSHDLVSVLHCLVSCIRPQLLSFLSHHYSQTLLNVCNAT